MLPESSVSKLHWCLHQKCHCKRYGYPAITLSEACLKIAASRFLHFQGDVADVGSVDCHGKKGWCKQMPCKAAGFVSKWPELDMAQSAATFPVAVSYRRP